MGMSKDDNIVSALSGFVVEVVHGLFYAIEVSVGKKNSVPFQFQNLLSHPAGTVTVANYRITLDFQLAGQYPAILVMVPGMKQNF